MKFSKSGLLSLSLLFTAMGLWLLAISRADRQLYIDVNNASQAMWKVKFISTWSEYTATLSQVGNHGSVKIQTNNFILTQTWYNEENIIITWSNSSILWWEKNIISGNQNVILWWEDNSIYGDFDVILWWESNKIENWKKHSVIVWWKNNTMNWDKSVILWSDNRVKGTWSIVVWNNSSVDGDFSAALWSNSHVNANNSFLWTDGNSTDPLTEDNVFVIMANKWMIVNTGIAHSFAKLTLWWPLIISNKDTDQNVQCEWSKGWILKVVNDENQMCLCSCDWSWRNSMLGKGRCMSICDSAIQPECGSGITRTYDGSKVSFSWSCKVWVPAKWTWAYFVDKHDIIHWSCQSDDGNIVECSASGTGGTIWCEWDCGYTCYGPEPDRAILLEWSDQGLTENTERTLYSDEDAPWKKCAYICDADNNFRYDKILKKCVEVSDPCTNDPIWCEPPFDIYNMTHENHKYTRNCKYWKIIRECTPKCEDWYEMDDNGDCIKITCHHCANKWFPYCFPINFSPSCTESNRAG